MRTVNVWNTTGEILEQFDTIEEAEEWIEECEHQELYRTMNGSDTNIAVLESY
jgi:hypothetical protein